MARKQRTRPDWWILVATLSLLAVGVIMVFSSSQYVADYKYNDPFYFLRTQVLAAAIGLVCLFLAYHMPLRLIRAFTWPTALLVLGLLVFMAFSSNIATIGGAERWLGIGGFRFQPSELCKVALPLVMARLLSERRQDILSFKRAYMPSISIIILASVLIVLQRDLSSAVVVAAAGFIIMFCAGINGFYLFGTAILGFAAAAAAIIMEPYRLERMQSWLDPWSDPLDTGMQMVQSLLAFGNGGLSGVGLGAGGSKWYYLPYAHNDFIFSVLGEELGFIGVVFVILLFIVLLWRGLNTAAHADDSFAGLLALGLISSIGVQTLINMGVVTGLLPVTGVTLPFISYGGTSLVVSLAAVGLLLNISRYTNKL